MWVYEEMIEGKKLTEIINETHENVKYLPGHKLPPNVVSVIYIHIIYKTSIQKHILNTLNVSYWFLGGTYKLTVLFFFMSG